MYSVIQDAPSLQSMQQLLEPLIRKVVSMITPGNMFNALFYQWEIVPLLLKMHDWTGCLSPYQIIEDVFLFFWIKRGPCKI